MFRAICMVCARQTYVHDMAGLHVEPGSPEGPHLRNCVHSHKSLLPGQCSKCSTKQTALD